MSIPLFSNKHYATGYEPDENGSADYLSKEMAVKIAAKDKAALEAARKDKRSKLTIRTENKKNKMLGMANIKARKYGVTPPNNDESFEYEKTHCISCGNRHHDPLAYEKLEINYLKMLEKLGQKSLGMLCCACFSRVKNTNKVVEVEQITNKRVLTEIYDPEKADSIPMCSPTIKFNIKQGDEISKEGTIDSVIRGSWNSRYGSFQ